MGLCRCLCQVAHRRLKDARIVRAFFVLTDVLKTLVASLLLSGAVLLAVALFWAVDPVLAQTIGVLGALVFVAQWSRLLMVSDFF